jgi:hypothetical protein
MAMESESYPLLLQNRDPTPLIGMVRSSNKTLIFLTCFFLGHHLIFIYLNGKCLGTGYCTAFFTVNIIMFLLGILCLVLNLIIWHTISQLDKKYLKNKNLRFGELHKYFGVLFVIYSFSLVILMMEYITNLALFWSCIPMGEISREPLVDILSEVSLLVVLTSELQLISVLPRSFDAIVWQSIAEVGQRKEKINILVE